MTKFWGSRFNGKTDKLADQFSFSISYDYRLAQQDCLAGIAHAKMLGQQGIIPKKDASTISDGLKKILKKVENGKFKYDPKSEDIHSNIQSGLKKLIGSAADKLHTARSRNDLIATDMKKYCSQNIIMFGFIMKSLQKRIVNLADKNSAVIMPAYTHLQSAQVVLFSHHMLAYVEMLQRDFSRLTGTLKELSVCPLGSCALSGTSLPIDRKKVAKKLQFQAVSENSIDSVSDRDFIIDVLSAIAITGMHCSRIAEDLIIWSTKEFNFVDIDWSLCTGSSIMPHKKNPDICELIRGETATLYSNLNKILVLMKGLPLTYNRDFQLDKTALFESVEKLYEILNLMCKLFGTLKVNKKVVKESINDEAFFSVDIMEYLIKKGVSYREAHDTVGKIIKKCLDKGKKIADLSDKELKQFHSKLSVDVKKLLNPENSVKIKKSYGSTNPTLVKKQIEKWKKKLK